MKNQKEDKKSKGKVGKIKFLISLFVVLLFLDFIVFTNAQDEERGWTVSKDENGAIKTEPFYVEHDITFGEALSVVAAIVGVIAFVLYWFFVRRKKEWIYSFSKRKEK